MSEGRAPGATGAAIGPPAPIAEPPQSATAHEHPRGDDAGLLFFPYSVSHVTIAAGDGRAGLYEATFSGPLPAIDVQGGLLRVAPRLRDRFSLRPPTVDLRLNQVIPWEIDARGDVFSLFADLASIDLRGASVHGVARDVVLRLGQPSGQVPLRVTGGARRFELRLPAGSSASLYLRHEPSNSDIQGREVTRRRGGRSLRIGAGADARDHYEIELLGDCDRVIVATRNIDSERAAA
jgi:hypothetical protein